MADLLGAYAYKAGVPFVSPTYRPVRKVVLRVTGWANGETMPDPDNVLKLFLDSCRRCGLIVDDSKEWCVWGVPVLLNGPDESFVVLEDLEAKPPCAAEEMPMTRALLRSLMRKVNRGDKKTKKTDQGR